MGVIERGKTGCPGLNWNCHVRASGANQRKNNLYGIEFNCEPCRVGPLAFSLSSFFVEAFSRYSPPSSPQTPRLAFAVDGTESSLEENEGELLVDQGMKRGTVSGVYKGHRESYLGDLVSDELMIRKALSV